MNLTDSANFLFALGLGVAAGVTIRTWVPDLERREHIALSATVFGIFTLLPIHIVLSGFIPSNLTIGVLAALSTSAVLFCSACYVVASLQRHRPGANPDIFPGVAYLACTFGGGTRGILMLSAIYVLVGSRLKIDQGVMIDSFAAFDTAYFLFFMMFGYGWTMKRDFADEIANNALNERPQAAPMGIADKLQKYRGQLAIGGAVLISLFIKYGLKLNEEDFSTALEVKSLRTGLSLLITFIAAAQITIAFKQKIDFEAFHKFVYTTYLSRIIGAFTIILLWRLFRAPPETFKLLAICVVIMTFVPPSSLLEGLMAEQGIPLRNRSDITTVNGLLNLFFIMLLLFLTALAVLVEYLS
jgi:hypothetical protein